MALLMEKPNGDGWAHLVSDLHGEYGGRELRRFLKEIGVARPLHRVLTYAEHCDIRGEEISRARLAGAAVITRRQLAKVLKEKKREAGKIVECRLQGVDRV